MPHLEIYGDAYPEQLLDAMREEIRRAERVQAARDAARLRRGEKRAALGARVSRWLRRDAAQA